MIITENLEIDTTNFVEYIKNILSTDKNLGAKLLSNITENNHLSQRQAAKIFKLCRQTIKKFLDVNKQIIIT